jgi:hypothetical protein
MKKKLCGVSGADSKIKNTFLKELQSPLHRSEPVFKSIRRVQSEIAVVVYTDRTTDILHF